MTEPNPLTRDELSELHGLALQLHTAGDPRAERVWKVVASQGRVPGLHVSRQPRKTTGWLEDLEKTLWRSRSKAGRKHRKSAAGPRQSRTGQIMTSEPVF